MVPVDSVVVGENYYVALSLSLLGAGHHGWNHQLLQVALKLPTGTVIGQLMEQSAYGQPMTTMGEWDWPQPLTGSNRGITASHSSTVELQELKVKVSGVSYLG